MQMKKLKAEVTAASQTDRRKQEELQPKITFQQIQMQQKYIQLSRQQ